MKTALPATLLAALLALVACSSGNDNPSIAGGGTNVGQTADVSMQAENGGQSGTATLDESPSLDLTVTIRLQNPISTQEPAGIHAGTCSSFTPDAKFALSSVANGASTTSALNTTLGELSSSPYVIVVQRSGTDPTAVSCGAIPQAASP